MRKNVNEAKAAKATAAANDPKAAKTAIKAAKTAIKAATEAAANEAEATAAANDPKAAKTAIKAAAAAKAEAEAAANDPKAAAKAAKAAKAARPANNGVNGLGILDAMINYIGAQQGPAAKADILTHMATLYPDRSTEAMGRSLEQMAYKSQYPITKIAKGLYIYQPEG